jgi:signal transduction histidine kinase
MNCARRSIPSSASPASSSKGIDGPITEKQAEDLTAIYNNGQHLLQMINEILDMAKIEAGKMALSVSTVDIVEAAQAARKTITGLIQEDKIKFVWDVPSQLPAIEADQVRLRQIFYQSSIQCHQIYPIRNSHFDGTST